MIGAGAVLVADGRANRVYSALELQQRLPYPVLCTLPLRPWTAEACAASLGQLVVLLDPSLTWRVVSVGLAQPGAAELVHALQQLWLDGDLAPGPVLVEPGFNSAAALDAAQRLLDQLPFVREVGQVLAG